MPVGKSGLNTGNKFVFLMERYYDDSRADLKDFMKLSVKNMLLTGIITLALDIVCIITPFIFGDWFFNPAIILNTVIAVVSILYIRKIMLRTHTDVTITAPNSRVLFGHEYNIIEINQTDVFNTTMLLREYIGTIKARRETVNIIMVSCILISVISTILCTLITIYI